MLRGYDETSFRARLQTLLTPAQPISRPEHLHGREQKLRLIDRALSSPGKHIFIYGDRGVGKTSLARTAASVRPGSVFAFVACDQQSTFFDIIEDIYRQLHKLYAPSAARIESAEISLPFVRFKAAEALGLPALKTINDAVEVLRHLIDKLTTTPLVIIDEFDQLSSSTERKYVADLIKQLSDQSINLRLMICGIGSSLEELIGVHLSTDRYVTPVPLEPLPHDARWSILTTAVDAFNVRLERDSVIRIGQLSDGFPYYVHLMGEQILWQAFDDPQIVEQISMQHYARGIKNAIEQTQTSLRQSYDLAIQKHKNSEDYEEALWSVADGPLISRQVTDIYQDSYTQLIPQRDGRTPLPKETFYQRLNSLKKSTHGSIVIANRQGWYSFRENVLRGYVRLRAERAGVHVGIDHIRG